MIIIFSFPGNLQKEIYLAAGIQGKNLSGTGILTHFYLPDTLKPYFSFKFFIFILPLYIKGNCKFECSNSVIRRNPGRHNFAF